MFHEPVYRLFSGRGIKISRALRARNGTLPWPLTFKMLPPPMITTQCYTIHFYYYMGATPYISITTRVLHHTSLLLHSATPYISITTQCYTIHFYYYTGAAPYINFLLLHSATPYISITIWVLHHTSLLLHHYTSLLLHYPSFRLCHNYGKNTSPPTTPGLHSIRP